MFVKGTSNGCGEADIIAVIASDDALKYENISGKAFTLKVAAKANWTKIDVEVAIAGSDTASGIISKTAWETEANIMSGHNGSTGKLPTTLFGVKINDFEEQLKDPVKREYYENVKYLISLRWKYKDILNASTANHRDTNICAVKLKGSTFVNGYARYKDDKGIIVVPNVNEGSTKAVEMTIALPLEDMGLDNYKTYTLTDLMTNEVMIKGDAKAISLFKDTIEHNTCGIYYLEAKEKLAVPDEQAPSDNTIDPDDELDEDEQEDEESTPSKKPVVIRKPKTDNATFPLWAIIAIAGGAVVIITAVVVIILLSKKRK